MLTLLVLYYYHFNQLDVRLFWGGEHYLQKLLTLFYANVAFLYRKTPRTGKS